MGNAADLTRTRRRAWLGLLVGLVALVVVLAACDASPIDNPTGTAAGLAPITQADHGRARAVIDGVRTASRGTLSGYSRDAFGPAWTDDQSAIWGHNGCDTRDDILKRDLTDVTFRADSHSCVVETGVLADPYTGHTIDFTKADAIKVQIDHVFPLADAWEMDADRWSEAERTKFANDPLELLAVNGPTNESKGDDSPSQWLPPNRSVDCAYAVRFAEIARAYALPVTTADRAAMLGQCP